MSDLKQGGRPVLLNEHLRPLFFEPWRIIQKQKTSSYRLSGVLDYGMYYDDDKECLVAFYGWHKIGRKCRKDFVWSKYGYEKAIEWIEDGRRLFIETLL